MSEQQGSTRKDTKADYKAAKAYHKAQRPWFKKKRWILSLGLLIVIVIAVAASGGGSSSSTESNNASSGGDSGSPSSSKSSSKQDGTSGSVGQKLTNAGTTYEVTSVKTADNVGGSDFGAKASGTFVIVQLSLTNNKDETKTFSDSSAKVVTSDGKSYKSSSDATLFFGDGSLLLKEIQPDLTTRGKIAFDLPPSKLAGSKLVIEDLFGSGEITVDLGL